ncbi:MAG: short-chain dehydrogenase/reductase [Candidatus Acidoferrum typicum]|nr:short-chain dehydrogenase/reductase [Candidatus Acidoferrum typicum]
MELGLKGKVAIVAGASRGLGFSVARALAQEGALVSIVSRDSAAITAAAQRIEEIRAGGGLGFSADIRLAEGIELWHRATVDRFGPVEILVTNSGGPPVGPSLSFDDQAWQGAFELLLLSAIRMVREVIPSMTERKKGSIVMLTSSSAKQSIANLALSNVMRPSVAALAKTLANEYAGHGIRVNQVVPGRIATDRVREIDELNSKKRGVSVEEQRKLSLASIPMARYGDPDEFGRAVAFLLSDAGSYITGATLQVDGGMIQSLT